ncbi:MAG: hypothetical protein CL395_02350 [Acidiferrobacteraceae bacterium]|nr:hypothetical protein [Acidiferrobacteraceae bacterium]
MSQGVEPRTGHWGNQIRPGQKKKVNLRPQVAKLTWRSRRGARELDGLLLPFIQENAIRFSPGEFARMERLLAQPDPVLLDWFLGRAAPGDHELADLIKEILSYLQERRCAGRGVLNQKNPA